MAGVLSYESLVHAMAGAVVSGQACGGGGGRSGSREGKGEGSVPDFILTTFVYHPESLLPPVLKCIVLRVKISWVLF